MKRFILPALLAVSCFAHAQVDLNRTVMTIDGAEVKGQEYYRTMEYLNGVGKNVGSGIMEMPPGLLTIDKIITDRLILKLAKKKGVYPSDAELKADVDQKIKENPDMLTEW